MFTDSHCHLSFPELSEQLPAILQRYDYLISAVYDMVIGHDITIAAHDHA